MMGYLCGSSTLRNDCSSIENDENETTFLRSVFVTTIMSVIICVSMLEQSFPWVDEPFRCLLVIPSRQQIPPCQIPPSRSIARELYHFVPPLCRMTCTHFITNRITPSVCCPFANCSLQLCIPRWINPYPSIATRCLSRMLTCCVDVIDFKSFRSPGPCLFSSVFTYFFFFHCWICHDNDGYVVVQ